MGNLSKRSRERRKWARRGTPKQQQQNKQTGKLRIKKKKKIEGRKEKKEREAEGKREE